MGALLSKQEAHSTHHTHATGYFYNCKLNDSTIKELRALRANSAKALCAQGRDDAFVESELRPLDNEIRRREEGPAPVQ
jgi:hypothetical protein